MSIAITCPGCSASYQLAESMRGKKARCKSCSTVFVVREKTIAPDRDEDEERIQDSPRPAKRVVRYEEDEDDERPLPRRRPRRKQSDSALVPLLIAGGIVAVVLIVGLGGVAIWALTRSPQPRSTPLAAPNPPPNAVQPAQNPPPPNQPGAHFPPGFPPVGNPMPQQGPLVAQLSNGKVSGFGAQMEVTVNYRFTSGNPAGRRLVLFLKATKPGGLRQSYYVAELHTIGGRTEGTIGARGMSFGLEHGPFEMWIGEAPPGVGLLISERELKKISNVVTVASKEHTIPGMPGMRPPFGPRGRRP